MLSSLPGTIDRELYRLQKLRGDHHLDALQQQRNALAAAYARTPDSVLQIWVGLHFVHEVRDDPGTARSRGVAQGDRTAVHVRLLAIQPELFLTAQELGRKRLVDLDAVDVADGKVVALEDAADRGAGRPLGTARTARLRSAAACSCFADSISNSRKQLGRQNNAGM